MGTWMRFYCKECPYEAHVSGGNDIGMGAATSTIRCYDCREIKDVVTTLEPWLAMDEDWVPTDFKCDASEDHRVQLWQSMECPKCEHSMDMDETFSVICWD